MPYKKESMLMGMDASADTSTQLSFNPPNGPFDADNVVTGTIAHVNDEDWIIIELSEGKEYTITVGGSQTAGELNDSVLKLMDSKGGLIDMNDDTDPAKGELGSELTFTPEAGSGTQKYYISVSGYTGNPGANNTGTYMVTVKEVVVLPAGESADIVGTDMADKLTGTDDSESIAGLAGDDTIYGLGGDDSLNGGVGADLLVGGPGGDELKGGSSMYDSDDDGEDDTEHQDTISYKGSPMGVTINLNDGTARGGHADGDTLGEDIENVMGTDHDDTITGTDDVNVGNSLWGLGSNDTLSGREGPDMLYGGAGDDSLDGGDENDILEGGPGADTLTGGLGADTASYASSMMGVTVRLHAQQAMGGDAEGDIWGDTVDVEYEVPAEDPEDPAVEKEETVPDIVNLTGSHLADILAGDSRDNTIKGNGGDDKLYGGPGGGDDTLEGGRGNDMLFGGRGNDTLSGGMGNDTLNGGSGTDDFDGGPGNDVIYADVDVSALSIDGDDIIDGGENPAGHPGDMDTLSFEKLVDTPVGATGDGNAFQLGGPGFAVNAARTGYLAADGTTVAVVNAVNIEHVIGTDEDDFIFGANQSADGENDAPEEIEGGDGGDTLYGGTGGGDTVSYESSDRRVRVDLEGSAIATTQADATDASVSGGHATGDKIYGFENIKGSAHGDVLTAVSSTTAGEPGAAGSTGSTLWGLGGDDSLFGGFGNDTIEGGAGADEMDGGEQANRADNVPNTQVNTLSYAGSDAGVTVNLATASASGGHAEGDEIETYELTLNQGEEDETEIDVATFVNVTGSAHNDNLTGDTFGNHLVGGAGDDSLRSGAGADTLSGGPGADRLDGGSSTLAEEDDTNTANIDESTTQHEDWAAYRGAMDGVTVNLNTGNGTGGDAMGDTLKNIELIWGSTHDDTFIASEGKDIIHGDGGSDTVSYEASKHGVDVTLAGTGDTPVAVNTSAALDATTGDPVSTFTPAVPDPDSDPTTDDGTPNMFNAATDTMLMNWRAGGSDGNADPATSPRPTPVEADDEVATTKSYAEGDILASIENITGSRQGDVITGDLVPNVIKGGGGNDTLSGGLENDKLHGGAGNDVLGARPVRDLDGDNTVTTSAEAAATDAGNDEMYGDAGNDTIYGGADNDILVGGAGDDDLSGGTGADTFVFGPGNGSDVIIQIDRVGGGTTGAVLVDGTATADGTGDKIDLSAFNIRESDLAGLISDRAGNAVINLEDYGGGRITIQGISKEELGTTVLNDTNGELLGFGTETGASDGIFIL